MSDIAHPPHIRLAWRRTDAPDAARALLGELLAPLGWDSVLGASPLGAPISSWLEARGLSVSLSQTAGIAACAVMAGGSVGVDVEAVDAGVNAMAVARDRLNAGAVARLASSTDRLGDFFRLWTLNEAALKALGVGFATPAGIAVSLDPPSVRGETPAGFAWHVFEIAVGPAHRMAVVALTPANVEPELVIEVTG